MSSVRRISLAMAGYLLGLLLLFLAAFVFLTGVGGSEPAQPQVGPVGDGTTATR